MLRNIALFLVTGLTACGTNDPHDGGVDGGTQMDAATSCDPGGGTSSSTGGGGCDTPDTSIPWATACSQQASAYCTAIGYNGSSGCQAAYATQCQPRSNVELSTQTTCLSAIRNTSAYCNALGCGEPVACSSIW